MAIVLDIMGLVCSVVWLLYGRALCAVVGVVSSPGQSAEASANAVQPLRVRLSRVNDEHEDAVGLDHK